MDILAACKNYFSIFQDISNFKTKNNHAKILTVLKLLSYCTFIVPISIGAAYIGVSLYQRKIINKKQLSCTDKSVNAQSEKVLKQGQSVSSKATALESATSFDDWKTITPETIDHILNVHQIIDKNHYFSMLRVENKKTGVVNYRLTFFCSANGCIGNWITVKDNKFILDKPSTSPERVFLSFNNLDELLKFLMKGDFYQGECYKSDYFLLEKADHTTIKYINPN